MKSLKWERKKVSLNKDIILIFPDLCKQVPFKGKNFLFSKYGLNRLEMETSRKQFPKLDCMTQLQSETDGDKQKKA